MTDTEERKTTTPQRPNHWTDVFVFALMLLMLMSFFDFKREEAEEVAYSEFKQKIRNNEIDSILINGDRIDGTYLYQSGEFSRFTTILPPFDDYDLFPLLEEYDIEVSVSSAEQSVWTMLLINLS